MAQNCRPISKLGRTNHMPTSPRFAELLTPGDLLLKLRHDLRRMEQSGSDQYVAFDFFVTADSMVDWVCPDETDGAGNRKRNRRADREEMRQDNALLRITSHIANGAKHFTVTKHNSVAGIEKTRYVEPGYVDDGYFEDPILLHLTSDERAKSGLGSTIKALDLARDVVQHWVGDPRVA